MTPEQKYDRFTSWSGILTVIVFLIVLLWALSNAHAATVQVDLGWDANTESDLAGYHIYSATGACASTPVTAFTPSGPMIPKPTITGSVSVVTTVDVTKSFRITAIDTAGNESQFSNCVEKFINVVPPIAPTGPVIRGTTVIAR